MEQENRERRRSGNPLSALTDKLGIRGKLMFAFAGMIILTLIVIGIATISSRDANTTIDELVQVDGKIARLSLDIEKIVQVMNTHEKDFLLNYNKIGIVEAKKQYLNTLIAKGGEAYQKLNEIQETTPDAQDKAAAQRAIEAINNYVGTFFSTVDTLESQLDPEFGELSKLRQVVDGMRKTMGTVTSPRLQSLFQSVLFYMQEYMIIPDSQFGKQVLAEAKAFKETVGSWTENPAQQTALRTQIDEFTKWFDDILKTDEVVNQRIEAYQQAVMQAAPIIQAFLKGATDREAQAVARMKAAAARVQQIVIGVGIAAVVLGLLMAFLLSGGLTRQVTLIMDLLSEMGMGNFKARTEVVSSDELGEMADALNAMLDSITTLIQSQEERDAIQESIMNLMAEISVLTEGDLTARAEVTEGITGGIADAFNSMADQFGSIVRQVQSATFSVDATATDVSKRTSDLAAKSTDQAQQVNIAIQALNDMATSIRQVSQHAAKSAEVSEMSRSNAREGAEAVEETNRAMEEIRMQINETARSIKRLGESSMEIVDVVEIINTIADRTSILALNASIQAAMAGDAGYGFAVVAEEVQRLAESSSNSTKQIDMLVKNIQSEIKDVSNRMDESISKVVQGSRLADGAHEKLQQIEAVSNQLADLIEAITQAAAQQVRMSENLVENMVVVGGASDDTSRISQETAALMDLLNTTAHQLREAVEAFKIEGAQVV